MNIDEIQLAHEKTEWAYATYHMTDAGCAYSNRFEYDKDKIGDREQAKMKAIADFQRLRKLHPKSDSYRDC